MPRAAVRRRRSPSRAGCHRRDVRSATAADARPGEDEETGAKRFKYVKTGEDHFSLAFTYAWMAARHEGGPRVRVLRIAPAEREFSFDRPVRSWLGHLPGRGFGRGILRSPRRW
jgi:hypothetical protein